MNHIKMIMGTQERKFTFGNETHSEREKLYLSSFRISRRYLDTLPYVTLA